MSSVLFDLILYIPVYNSSVMSGQVFLGWTGTKQRIKGLAQGHREARTYPSFSSQALYH